MEMNVRAAEVTRRFGRTEVLKNVNLSVGRGVFGLLGPNGAGKTTLLRTLATAIEPSTGSLTHLTHELEIAANPVTLEKLLERLSHTTVNEGRSGSSP